MSNCRECDFVQPEGLRWLKPEVSIGIAVIEWGENTRKIIWELAQRAANEWMDQIEGHLRLNLVDLGETINVTKQADIVVTAANIDGQGNTLGMTYQPTQGDSMEVCGLCGDIVMDKHERWTQQYFFAVFKHELGHAIGLDHSPINGNLMWPSYTGSSVLGPWDIEQANLRYPASNQLARIYEKQRLRCDYSSGLAM